MLLFGFCALSIAVGLGVCLATGRWYRTAAAHGLSGLAGLGALAVALIRGAFVGPFAWDAVILTGAAACGGVILYGLARRRRARPGLLVALHAVAGGSAYLLLTGFVFGR